MMEPRPGKDRLANGIAEAPPRMPRWVKVTGVAVAGLLIVAAVVAIASGGEHGPGRHLGAVNKAGAPADRNAAPAAEHAPPAEHAAPP